MWSLVRACTSIKSIRKTDPNVQTTAFQAFQPPLKQMQDDREFAKEKAVLEAAGREKYIKGPIPRQCPIVTDMSVERSR